MYAKLLTLKIEEADELYSRILDVQRAIKDILNDEATKPLQENVAEVSPSPIQASEPTIDILEVTIAGKVLPCDLRLHYTNFLT